jgi:GH25 family lysozyme M1 (1,4-beta-N-acetylmuramidase)
MDSQTNEVFLKVSQNTWKDEKFERNYSEAKKRGIFVGGYTFYDGRVSPDQQFNTINAAMQGKTFELEYIVDWEHSYGGSYEGLPNAVKLMKKVEGGGIVCHSVGMYTGYYWFVENSNAQANAAEYDYVKNKPLWLAWYASPDVVRIPPPWTNWTFWQFGTPPDGALYGVETVEIDMNKFRD